MAIQYTNWTYAPFPTQVDTISPIASFVSPPTPLEGARINTRTIAYQWTANKENCEFRYKGSWEAAWSAWGSVTSVQSENLPNGNYSISVQAKDYFGNESAAVTRAFVVFRELPVPVLLAPAVDGILDDTDVAFVCEVPRGENGQTWHFEFQIARDQSMTQLVDNITWFSSVNGYAGFSYNAPVPENIGGTISFNKVLQTRTKYWWRCRVRLAGTNLTSAASAPQAFVVGVLGTQLTVMATPVSIRADGNSQIAVRAEVQDALGRIDVAWAGAITFSIATGSANFVLPAANVPLSAGAASTALTSNVINTVGVYANIAGLPLGSAEIDFLANSLPAAPVWQNATVNPPIISASMATVTCAIPADIDNDKLHFMVEIDTTNTFDSPSLFVAESRFSTVGWEYFDGTNWLAFPNDGVMQGNGLVRYTTIHALQDTKTYYARICAWDKYEI